MFSPAGSWDDVSPVSSEEIEVKEKKYHIVPLKSLMKRGAALAKSCGTLRPRYSNYLVEQDIEVIRLRAVVFGRIIEHHGTTLRQSWMSLGDHLRLREAKDEDELAFSPDDFKCIEEALTAARSKGSTSSKSTARAGDTVLPLPPADDFPLAAFACAAIFAGLFVGSMLTTHWRRMH